MINEIAIGRNQSLNNSSSYTANRQGVMMPDFGNTLTIISAQLGISILHLVLILLIALLAARKYRWARKPAIGIYIIAFALFRIDLLILFGMGFLVVYLARDMFVQSYMQSKGRFFVAVAVGIISSIVAYRIGFH